MRFLLSNLLRTHYKFTKEKISGVRCINQCYNTYTPLALYSCLQSFSSKSLSPTSQCTVADDCRPIQAIYHHNTPIADKKFQKEVFCKNLQGNGLQEQRGVGSSRTKMNCDIKQTKKTEAELSQFQEPPFVISQRVICSKTPLLSEIPVNSFIVQFGSFFLYF